MIKRKLNTAISLFLAVCMFAMVAPISATASPATNKITNYQQAIQLIEKSYLGVRSNGASYIKAGAANYIAPRILAEVTKGMNAVNAGILSGTLVRDQATGTITAVNKSGGITSDVVIYGTITYTWYGFTFCVNAYYSGLLAIEFNSLRNTLLGGGAVAGLFGATPVALAAGIGAFVYNEWETAAQLGQANGKGCTEYFFGTTSAPLLFNVITNS